MVQGRKATSTKVFQRFLVAYRTQGTNEKVCEVDFLSCSLCLTKLSMTRSVIWLILKNQNRLSSPGRLSNFETPSLTGINLLIWILRKSWEKELMNHNAIFVVL